MKTSWSIYSGGRLNTTLVQNVSFKITTDDALDSILFRSESLKQDFAKKLLYKLSGLTVSAKDLRTYTLNFHSSVVEGEFSRRDLELTVLVMDDETGLMLWYFVLSSAARNIATEDFDEIVALIVSRLGSTKEVEKHKCWL
jgi:hypothetical protein